MNRRCLALALAVAVAPAVSLASSTLDGITTLPIVVEGRGKAVDLDRAAAKSAAGDVALDAAAWLEGQQKVAPHPSPGAFPWTADDANVYSNTQGATALGLVRAWERTGESSVLQTALDNGNCIVTKCIANMAYTDGDHRFATHDPLFLQALSAASGNALYASYVDTFFWDKLASGTYGETNDLDAGDFAQFVLDARTGQSIPELVAWDLSKPTIAAAMAGETVARDAFMARVLASLETAGAPNDTYDVVGLAGGLWAAATAGVELDPTAGAWAADDSNLELATRLLTYQSGNGGFIVGTSQPVDDAETSAQSTAFAMQALAAVDADLFADEINAGFAYLVSLQQPSGQFLSFAGASGTDDGSVESHGETLEAYSVLQLGPDRWVDASTGADAGSCSSPAAPCLTIQYAVDQAFEGDTIHIASGDYVEKVVVATDGLLLRGEGATTPTLAFASGGTNQSLLSVDGAADVTVENLAFIVDVSYLGEGVLCTNGCTRLTVRDSSFTQLQSTATRSSYGRTNAISAGVLGTHPEPVEITVQGNTIAGDPGSPTPTQFRAGVALDNGFGLVGGAGAGEGNDIVSVNHDVIVRNGEGGPVTIQGNTFRGFGVQYTTPRADAGPALVTGNDFLPLVTPDAPAPAADFSAMRLISNQYGIAVTVSDNVFDGHERGILVENFPGVLLEGNSFTPRAGSSSFQHLVLSNKELFTNASPPLPLPQSLAITARGNSFNAGTLAGTGTAVFLLNDNAQGEPAGGYYGSIAFGGAGPGEANSFDGGLGYYFELGNFACADSNTAPCPLAAPYTVAIGPNPGTPVIEFAGNASAADNLFDGVAPAAMDAGQRNALLARTQDSRADADLGTVDYGFMATQPEVFVDDDFAGAGYGDELSMVHSDGSVNGRTVYFGIDAFASIGDALMAVEEDGTVWIADGSYAGAVTVSKRLDIRGDGSVATTTIAGPFSVTASGIDPLDPLVFSGFVVSNPAGIGLSLGGTVSNLRFEGVAFEGNASYGVGFAGTGNDSIAFVGPDCRISNNLAPGVRTSTMAVASGVSFDGCVFENNRGGIVLFGGSGSGTGQVIDWSVSNSQFIANEPTDSQGFGGGIWIKTGGAGSVIDGFSVTGSTFEDNGASNPLNQVGITIRARPDTTLAGVSVCNNSFAETAAPGTQTYGILVFDDTDNDGYEPIEVCASNAFDGLEHSVSGVEQFDLRGTEPLVTFTGGSIEDWEYLSFPEVAVAYVDDDFAGSTNGATVAFPGNPGPGCAAAQAFFGIDAFASIADALDQLQPGGTVCVAAGSYVEGDTGAGVNLSIARSAALYGAQAGVDARGRADAGASIVLPAHANPSIDTSPNASFASLVDVLADNVTIDGFVFDGDNPAIASALTIGGANPDVDGGMQVLGSGIAIHNNVVRNLVYSGIEGYSFPLSEPVSEGNSLHRNWVHNLDAPSDWGIGIIIHYNFYAAVTQNLVEDVRIGLQTGNHTKPVANPPTDAVVQDNLFEASASGIYHNAQYANASPFTFDGNTVLANANPAQDGVWAGFALGALNDATTATVLGQVIDGSALDGSGRIRVGYRASLISTSLASAVAIDGGSVANVEYGVLATDGAFFAGAQDDVLVTGVAFSNIDRAALFVEDTALAGAETVDHSPRLTVGPGNSFSNVAHEGALAGPLARIEFAPGAPLLQTVLVRAAGEGHRGALDDSNGNVRMVAPGVIDDAIDDVASGGTVSLEAGEFDQTVAVDKGIALVGPFEGIPGHDVSRDGSGEAVLSPAAGRALRVLADDVRVDGLTIADVFDTAISSGVNYGGVSANVTIANNRVVDVRDGSGLYTNGPVETPVVDWTVADNLFRNIESPIGSGINLWKVDGGTISGNRVEDASFGGIQVNQGNAVVIAGNTIVDTAHNGINVAQSSAVVVSGNSIANANTSGSADEAGITLYGGSSDVEVSCNAVTGSGSNGVSTAAAIASPLVDVSVFHNALLVDTDVVHALAADFMVGSNWYGGSAPSTSAASGNLFVADPLPADPVGDALCGDNSPVALALASGDGQSTVVAQAFAAPLEARVTDALGGAVAGIDVDFAAPVGGASATPTAATVATDFNGVAALAVTANTVAGSYQVDAGSASADGAAAFGLTNLNGPAVAIQAFAGDNQDVVAGALVPVPPAVQAVDSFGNGVAGIPVGFEIAQGGGSLSGATQATGAGGVAAVGSWTTGRNAGSKQLEASVPGQPALGTVAFTANAAEQADVAVAKTSTQSIVAPGDVIDYLITVTNNGPSHAQAVDILDLLPAQVDETASGWLCVASGGASCNGADDGTGDVAVTASVPFGSSVSIVLSTPVRITVPDGDLDNTAVVALASGTDPNAGNDQSTRTVSVVGAGPAPDDIFSDGFEGEAVVLKAGDGGAKARPVELTPDWAGLDLAPRPVLELRDEAGAKAASVDAIGLGVERWMRLRHRGVDGMERAGAWQRWDRADALLDWQLADDGTPLLHLVGERALIEQALPAAGRPATARGQGGARLD